MRAIIHGVNRLNVLLRTAPLRIAAGPPMPRGKAPLEARARPFPRTKTHSFAGACLLTALALQQLARTPVCPVFRAWAYPGHRTRWTRPPGAARPRQRLKATPKGARRFLWRHQTRGHGHEARRPPAAVACAGAEPAHGVDEHAEGVRSFRSPGARRQMLCPSAQHHPCSVALPACRFDRSAARHPRIH